MCDLCVATIDLRFPLMVFVLSSFPAADHSGAKVVWHVSKLGHYGAVADCCPRDCLHEFVCESGAVRFPVGELSQGL